MNRISVINARKIFQGAIWQMHDVRPATIVAHHER